MPFTQREIDEAYELMCSFHGVDSRELFGHPPLLGSDIPRDIDAPGACDALAKAIEHRSNR